MRKRFEKMRNLRVILTTIIAIAITIFIGSALRSWYLFLKEPESPAVDALPANTAVIIRTQSVYKLLDAINNSSMLDLFYDSKTYISLNQYLDSISIKNGKLFRLIERNEVLFAFTTENNKIPRLLVITPIGKTGYSTIQNQIEELLDNETYAIVKVNDFRKITNGENELWYYVKQGIFALSDDSLSLVTSYNSLTSKERKNDNRSFSKLLETGGKSVDANVLINNRILTSIVWPAKEKLLTQELPLSDWASFDLNIKKGEIVLDGFTIAGEENLLEDQQPVEAMPLEYYPNRTAFGLTILLSDPDKYIDHIIKQDTFHVSGYDNTVKQKTEEIFRVSDNVRSWIGNSVSLIFTNDYFRGFKSSQMVIISHKDADSAKYYLRPFLEVTNDSVDQLHYQNLASDLWGDLFKMSGKLYCKVTSQFVLISPDRNLLLTDFSTVRNQGKELRTATENSGNSSNLFIYLKPDKISKWFSNSIKGEYDEWVRFFGKNHSVGLQYSAGDQLAYTHAWMIPNTVKHSSNIFAQRVAPNKNESNKLTTQRTEESRKPKIIQEDETINKAPLNKDSEAQNTKEISIKSEFYPPQIVSGVKRNEKRIALLTKEGTLHLYDHHGKQLWKLNISGKPSANVVEADYKHNGKMHYIIASGNRLYIIDPDGKQVKDSPIKLPSSVFGEISLFDYDNKKDYRLLYVGNDHFIYNTTLGGLELPDWKKPKVKGNGKLMFFRANGKDYLVYKYKDEDLKIFDRRGRERINLSDPPLLSSNTLIFENKTNSKGIFLSAGKSGEIKYINSNGIMSTSTISKFTNPWFTYSDINNDGSSDFIYVESNRLICYNRLKEVILSKTVNKARFGIPFIYSSSSKDKWIFIRDLNSLKIIAIHNSGKSTDYDIKSDTDPIVFNPGGSLKEMLVTTRNGKLQLTELEGL